MAKSRMPVTPTWGALLDPDEETSERLRSAGSGATQLVQCGGERDAVVIAPLQRGLAALDAMHLPVADGYSILADHMRQELIVLVPSGNAHTWTGVPGVRVLSLGSWLLVPAYGADGSFVSAWLSQPMPSARWAEREGRPSLGDVSVAVDVAVLRTALAMVDRSLAESEPAEERPHPRSAEPSHPPSAS